MSENSERGRSAYPAPENSKFRVAGLRNFAQPVIWNMDQDAWAAGLDYSRLPLEISGRMFEAVRNTIINYAGTSYEQRGNLEFVHSVTGVRTLKDEFDKVAFHNEHHLRQIRDALSG